MPEDAVATRGDGGDRLPAVTTDESIDARVLTQKDTKNGHDRSSLAVIPAAYPSLSPRIVTPRRRLQCVPYARRISGIPIRGDARTWWRAAAGRFDRGTSPMVGAVMVMKGTRRIPRGHVAVVTKVLSPREIVVDHANWLNRERIHLGTPVIDVSRKNDWSAVRVWYTPGGRYGAGVYPTYGFIYPEQPKRFTTVVAANIRQRPSTKATRITTLPRKTMVEVVEKVSGAPWYRVAHRGKILGYVYAPLVKPTS